MQLTIVLENALDCRIVCACVYRRELRRRGKERVPLKSREWVMAKKQRKRKQGKYVEIELCQWV